MLPLFKWVGSKLNLQTLLKWISKIAKIFASGQKTLLRQFTVEEKAFRKCFETAFQVCLVTHLDYNVVYIWFVQVQVQILRPNNARKFQRSEISLQTMFEAPRRSETMKLYCSTR